MPESFHVRAGPCQALGWRLNVGYEGREDEAHEFLARGVCQVKEMMMGEFVHISKVKIYKEPGRGKVKQVYIEGFPAPIRMGVHGGIKKFYGVEPEEDLPATLDHVIAAVGG